MNMKKLCFPRKEKKYTFHIKISNTGQPALPAQHYEDTVGQA